MDEEKYEVFIAEDSRDIIEVLTLYLENAGYRVRSAEDGITAWKMLRDQPSDIGIFDIMMPGIDGYTLIKRVRESSNMPILVLSAKGKDSEKILGLDLGADDYLTKPFNPLEIVARVRSSLRRYYKLNDASSGGTDILRNGNLCIDRRLLQFWKDGREIPLTPTEFRRMSLFMANPGRVYTKVQLYEYLNGEYFENDENTIMVHISNLREKIEDNSRQPEYLITVRGLGYKLNRRESIRDSAHREQQSTKNEG